jgi:transmembrane sensor
MTELDEQLRSALAQIDDTWTPARTERGLVRVRRRAGAGKVRKLSAYVAFATAAAAAAAFLLWPSPPPAAPVAHVPAPASQPMAASQPRHMQFEDGSQLELLDPSARIVVDEVTRERIQVRLLTGRARVDVVPRKERSFRVQCGQVAVEVLGTSFELTREGERTRVSVLRGRVAVHWPDGSTQLTAGEVGWFPKPPAPPLLQPTAAERRSHARKHRARPVAPDSWQAQAERGDYERAYELMSEAPEPVSDDVQDLLLAADAARLSGHPAQAVPYLRRVVEKHPKDPRASLAAFTLGGVLLNQLDRPREAEAEYARARTLALSPALAQDALARQVEAAQRAGDDTRMRELAREYLRRYPDGRRVQWVKQLSGS